MSGFARHRRSGRVIATFTGFEADLLRSLASQLVELLRNERAAPVDTDDPLEAMLDFSGPVSEPEDPVLARLFPTAYPGDEQAAAEFRRFTEGGLRDEKAAAAGAIIDALEEAGLPSELAADGQVLDDGVGGVSVGGDGGEFEVLDELCQAHGLAHAAEVLLDAIEDVDGGLRVVGAVEVPGEEAREVLDCAEGLVAAD